MVAPAAQAVVPSVFGGAVTCNVLPSNGNIRLCSGFTLNWDKEHPTKIDVNVFLPPERAAPKVPIR